MYSTIYRFAKMSIHYMNTIFECSAAQAGTASPMHTIKTKAIVKNLFAILVSS